MKYQNRIFCALALFLLLSCSIKEDENAGVSITGNTGKISGVVLSSEKTALSKKAAVIEEMVLVELQSSAKGFDAESLYVNLKEAFTFDSLPPGDYQITITQEEEQLAILRDIPLEDGEAVRVTMYVGENAPESEWVPMGLGKVQLAFPALRQSTLYIHSKDLGSVAVMDVSRRDSFELTLEEGDYRAVLHADELGYGGVTTEFLDFNIKAFESKHLGFESLDTMGEATAISSEDHFPNPIQNASVNDNHVEWEGYQWSGYEAKTTKNRYLMATNLLASCTYGDTIKRSTSESHPVVFLVDENGYGIQVRSSSGQSHPIHIARLDPKGFQWDWDETKVYESFTDSIRREMPSGETFIPSLVIAKIIYEGDTILKVNQSIPSTWNNINAIYTSTPIRFPIPGLPTHIGLWVDYTWFGFNKDGDPWRMLSVSNEELILVDYPKTGDTLAGIMVHKPFAEETFSDASYLTSRVYSHDKIVIHLSVRAPYMISSYETE